ncbi:lamin tail domain-containing protein [Longibacter salinarum]|nr:lamin tail domain-containing protein [Longibacter salinarum]
MIALPSSALAQTTIVANDFEQGLGTAAGWTTFDASGSNNWVVDSYSGNQFAEMTEYQGDGTHDDWLISPEINLDNFTGETLEFATAVGYSSGQALEVVISTDYQPSVNSDPASATWTPLSANYPSNANGFSSQESSGTIDLSSFSGTAYLAWHFDETSGQGTWQLDDIVVEGSSTQPVLSFVNETGTISEDGGSTTITVEIQNVNGSGVSADVALSGLGGAEAADLDVYTAQTVSFPASASNGDTQSITVNVTDDSEVEGDEVAIFSLENASGAFASAENFSLTITDNDAVLVINEILADPAPDAAGDANGDGTRDGSEDEFVEIYNSGTESVDLSGYVIQDGYGDRHTFPTGTTLPAETAVVVFGGGSPSASIPGVVQTASSGMLGFNNSGDTVTLVNAGGGTVGTASYGSEGGNDESLTREPDFTGSFVQHSTASGSGGALFSPGRTLDGSALPVELAAFDGQFTGSSIALTWKTLSETKNAGFEIQHKAPSASSFSGVGFVEGNGTTNQASDYRFILNSTQPGTHTFRLMQVDVDGEETIHSPITVQVTGDPVSLTGPNPATPGDRVGVFVQVESTQQVDVAVYNLLGQKVATVYNGPISGSSTLNKSLDLSSFTSGVYFVRVIGETVSATERLSVVR